MLTLWSEITESHSEAQKKLLKAEAGDQLSSTDTEKLGRGKRKRKIIHKFSSLRHEDSDLTDCDTDCESEDGLTYPDIPVSLQNQGNVSVNCYFSNSVFLFFQAMLEELNQKAAHESSLAGKNILIK